MAKWKSPFGNKRKEKQYDEDEQEERPVEDDRDEEVAERKRKHEYDEENDEEEENTNEDLSPKKRRELSGYGTDDDMFIEGRKEFKMPISSRLYKETILTFLDSSDIELHMNSKALARFIKSLR